MSNVARALTPSPATPQGGAEKSPGGQRGTSSGNDPSTISGTLDMERIRADFPILKLKVGGKDLVYLDNAASSQMPQPVIDRLVRYQTTQHANINRAVHYLSEVATAEYQEARCKLARFINAR